MAIAGLNAALKRLDGINIKNILESEKRSHICLLKKLHEFNNLEVISPMDGVNSIPYLWELVRGMYS